MSAFKLFLNIYHLRLFKKTPSFVTPRTTPSYDRTKAINRPIKSSDLSRLKSHLYGVAGCELSSLLSGLLPQPAREIIRCPAVEIISSSLKLHSSASPGLGYLHELCTPSIVHRDVKTPNILLDKNLVGILSDFGFSRAFNDAHTHLSTMVAGTRGYLDPDYHATFQLTVKTDVYSFGIVLLEIITGQPPVIMDPQPVQLPSWVRKNIAKGNIHDVVDKKLLDQYDVSPIQGVIDLAMNCVENAAVDRATMTEVISRLKVWLPAVSSEKQAVSRTPRYKNSMDTKISQQIQLKISGVSNEGSSGYTGGVSEISLLSGR